MKLLKELMATTTPAGFEKPVRDIVLREVLKADHEFIVDTKGNVIVTIGKTKSLFLSHMDSVHNDSPMMFTLDNKGIMGLHPDCKQRALGADDKAGVRVMLEMISNHITGLYAFCVEEEVGCVGSGFLNETLDLTGITQAISFDRRGTSSIITTMMQGECCSKGFAKSLIKSLNKGAVNHAWTQDPTGSVTDSMSFCDKVINYTNISVGYYNEHSKKETLDTYYLLEVLMPAALQVSWELLSEEAPTPYIDTWEEPYNLGDTLWGYFSDHAGETFTSEEVVAIIEAAELGQPLGATYEGSEGSNSLLDPIEMDNALLRYGL